MAEATPLLTWISPDAATQLLAPLYQDTASAQMVLVQHAAAALVRSYCRRKTESPVLASGGSTFAQDNAWVLGSFWEAYADTQRRTFTDWGTGSFGANIFQGPSGNMGWWRVRVFHVQFCEEDIRAIPGVAPRPLPPEVQQAKNLENWGRLINAIQPGIERLAEAVQANRAPAAIAHQGHVTGAEVMAWYSTLSEADQLLSGKRLWAKAKTDFHPRKVLRKLFDPITETRKPGPRPRP